MPKVLRAFEATATASTAAATAPALNTGVAANSGGWQFIKGFIITVEQPVTTAAIATLTGQDAIATLHFNIPTNAIFPYIVWYPDEAILRVANNTPAVLTVPSLGTGVVCTAQLYIYAY